MVRGINDGRLQKNFFPKPNDPENTQLQNEKKLLSHVKGTLLAILSVLDSHSIKRV